MGPAQRRQRPGRRRLHQHTQEKTGKPHKCKTKAGVGGNAQISGKLAGREELTCRGRPRRHPMGSHHSIRWDPTTASHGTPPGLPCWHSPTGTWLGSVAVASRAAPLRLQPGLRKRARDEGENVKEGGRKKKERSLNRRFWPHPSASVNDPEENIQRIQAGLGNGSAALAGPGADWLHRSRGASMAVLGAI